MSTSPTLSQQAADALTRVRRGNPLVHNITNVVVTNFTANGLLALGASPVMAYAIEEVADMAKLAGALVLNMGTLTAPVVEAMIAAGQSANRHGVPVVFDPVGAGATPYRTETARRIVRDVKVSVLRGNAAEVAQVIGEAAAIKGVDAGASSGDPAELAVRAARQLGVTVVVTGAVDIATDGETVYRIANGHPILTKVTGTGCLLSSVIGAFVAGSEQPLLSAAAALTCYGVAAERAVASLTQGANAAAEPLPGSFQIALLDQLAALSEADVLRDAKLS